MEYINVRQKFTFSLEGNIALGLACFVRTQVVCGLEVPLQRFIVVIVYILVVLTAKMTRQMHPTQMIKECLIIKEEFFAKLAPWMRQDFGATLISGISVLQMVP